MKRGVYKAQKAGRLWEKGLRHKRTVWDIATEPTSDDHYATFPQLLVEPCVKAGCPEGGMVLDPFGGTGTTGIVAEKLGRNSTLIELVPATVTICKNKIHRELGMFANIINS